MKLFCGAAIGGILALSATAGLAGSVVYVPEGSGDSVLVVEADTGRTVRRIPGLEAVHGLAGAPGVPYLVAGSYAETDPAAPVEQPEAVAADEHAAHHPGAAAAPMGPPGAGVSLLTVLDAASGAILRRIEVPGAVHHTAVSPDGAFAVATHPAGGGISVIDLREMRMVRYIPTGEMPNYAVFGADPGVAYVSNAGNGTVSEVDLARGIVRRNLIAGTAPEHLAIDPARGALYVADTEAEAVLELGLADGAQRRSFEIGGTIHGMAETADGAALIVAGQGEDKLASVDLGSGTVRFAPLAPEPYHVTAVPGTGTLFVSSRAEPKVWIVSAETLAETGAFDIEGEGHQMVALP